MEDARVVIMDVYLRLLLHVTVLDITAQKEAIFLLHVESVYFCPLNE